MATVVTDRQPAAVYRFPTIRWSAVFGGWLVATGLAWLMYVLGLAVGFTAIDASDLTASGRAIGIGTIAWLVLTWTVSLFLGGMFASWLDGTTDSGTGTLHGVAVWALATSVSVVLVTIGFSNIVQGGASLVRSGAGAMTGIAGQGTGGTMDGAAGALQAELKQQIAETLARDAQGAPERSASTADSTPSSAAGSTAPSGASAATRPSAAAAGDTAQPSDATSATSGAASAGSTAQSGAQLSSAEVRRAMEQIDNRTTAAVATDLLRGNTEQAKMRLAAETTLTRAEVDQVVQGVSQRVDRYKVQAQEAADKAAGYTSAALWALFLSTLLALLAAALGGWMGAGNVERVYDTRL